MNSLKLSIENFQSISKGELEFQAGLNLVVGQSNSGKTSTFRALKACLVNPSGSQRYIKWNQKKACVTLNYNGNEIIWKRTHKESSYEINGETYVKTGASSAFKILEGETGFIKDENSSYIMNIEEELQLPFPMGMSKAELFKLYENVFCISDSAVILKSAKDQEEEAKGNINNLELELAKNTTKITELEKFKKEINISKLKEMKNSLIERRDRLTELSDGIDIIKKALKVTEVDVNVVNIDFENKLQSYSELISCKKTIITIKELHKLNKELDETSIDISSKLEEYNKLKELDQIRTRTEELSKINVDLVSFESKMQEYEELKEYKIVLNKIRENLKNSKTKLESTNKEIEELEAMLKEFKVCPLCHSILN